MTEQQNAMQPYGALQQALSNSLASVPVLSGMQFLKLAQNGHPSEGHFVYGVDQIAVAADAQWVLDPNSIQHGFLLRKKGANQPLSELLVPISQFLPGTPGGIELPSNQGGIWNPAFWGCFFQWMTRNWLCRSVETRTGRGASTRRS